MPSRWVIELAPNLCLPTRALRRNRTEAEREKEKDVDMIIVRDLAQGLGGPVDLKSRRQPLKLQAQAEVGTSLEAAFLQAENLGLAPTCFKLLEGGPLTS